MTLAIVLHFVVVLAAIWMGSRYSGVGLGLWGGGRPVPGANHVLSEVATARGAVDLDQARVRADRPAPLPEGE
jgi:anaerobic C4-dicarboxylate transporter